MASTRVAASKAAGQTITPAAALNTIGSQLHGELQAHIMGLKSSGQLSAANSQAVIAPLMAQAAAGTLHPADAAITSSPLGQLGTLGLPASSVAILKDGLLDLSTVNNSGGAGRGLVAPVMEKLTGAGAARVAEATLGTMAGFHTAGIEGAALGGMAGTVLPLVAGAVARGMDRVIGANAPPVMAQTAKASAALRAAGLPTPTSSLDALQVARQSEADNADSAWTPEAAGAAKAASNQAGLIAKLGPSHPVGAAALAALRAGGNDTLATQALTQYDAMGGVRSAQAAGAAHDMATAHQLNLDAAGETPGGGFGIDAINAAGNEAAQKARATMRLAGGAYDIGAGGNRVAGGASGPGALQASTDSQSAPEGLPGTFGTTSASWNAATPSPSTEVRSGLLGLSSHLGGMALWNHGVTLSPSDLQAGLTSAAAAGKLSPAQFDVLNQHLIADAPLHHVGGAADDAMNAILSHALATKTGGDIPPVATGARSGGSDSPPIYSPTRYANTVTTNQNHLNDIASQADATGDKELGDLARQLRVTGSVPSRQALRDGVVKARLGRGDIAGAARVRALLPDALVNAGGK